MLQLININKDYLTGDNTVHALKNINLSFRSQEFVSILGPSGCGKTTLLNIIGGLDKYTSGDLIINNISTKEYSDKSWDNYRNHSIGFVFQSYNLIPHQNVLANVELALTLSGIDKNERKHRAIDVLTKVGLKEQLFKMPNELSGGQMQRVAIARALVNNPDILLADEPTGALDTETSIQVLDLLKEVASDKLVIMVTHNPELAIKYSDRIIKLLDGQITEDSNPYNASEAKNCKQSEGKAKTTMSFFTALSLSITNLLTKKTRTFLTAFAGSIGIIGIALILSLSSGIQNYIDRVEEETLSAYPITIEEEAINLSKIMESFVGKKKKTGANQSKDKIYSKNLIARAIKTLIAEAKTNNLAEFKRFLDSSEKAKSLTHEIQYNYDVNPLIYLDNTDNILQVNPFDVSGLGLNMDSSLSNIYSSFDQKTWTEMIDNVNLLKTQYELVDGSWPQGDDECVLVIGSNNQIYDLTMYALGLKDTDELYKLFFDAMNNIGDTDFIDSIKVKDEALDFSDFLGLSYKLVLPTDRYNYNPRTGHYEDMSKDKAYMASVIKSSHKIELVGIIRQKEDSVASSLKPGTIAYTSDLTKYYIKEIEASEIVSKQLASEDIDILTNLPFEEAASTAIDQAKKAQTFKEYVAKLLVPGKAELLLSIYTTPSEEEIAKLVKSYMDKYPTRAQKEEAIIAEFIKLYNNIQSGDADMSILTSLGIEEFLLKPLEGMTEAEISVYLKATYGDISDELLNKAFKEAVTIHVTNSYSDNLLSNYDSYSNKELAAMLDEYVASLNEEELAKLYDTYKASMVSKASYKDNLKLFGLCHLEEPSSINLYAKSFKDKEALAELIEEYNQNASEANKITYNDIAGLMMSSVSDIIDTISYVLIAFVSISLIVSSIMIGIITYISVLERTKEIGILRAIGASKRDIKHVFNSESVAIGFVSGVFGILVTVLINIPICIIVKNMTGVDGVASLPFAGGIILIVISMLLTYIAGSIPARIAAKKDPVNALRSE